MNESSWQTFEKDLQAHEKKTMVQLACGMKRSTYENADEFRKVKSNLAWNDELQ